MFSLKKSFTFIMSLVVLTFFAYMIYMTGKPDLAVPIKETFDILESINREINNPPPLDLFDNGISGADLTTAGILERTNEMRRENGNLKALSQNNKLELIADKRLDDMFQKQYFEHVSPTGVSVSDIATENGYQYITIGENIALGNFEGDIALVQAWMDSPGHRANILNARYSEIGIAAKEGTYENKKTWMAIQVFALPVSACPSIDETLRQQIASNGKQIISLENDANDIKNTLESSKPKSRTEVSDYNKNVYEYNKLIRETNLLIDKTKELIVKYNAQVDAFNVCAKGS